MKSQFARPSQKERVQVNNLVPPDFHPLLWGQINLKLPSFLLMWRRNMRILIVDDDYKLASMIQEILEAEGHEIRLAGDGRFGYLTYLLFRPELVITDLYMPEENGIKLMKRIRIHNPNVKTIYMSEDLNGSLALHEEEKTRYQVGLLQKPFSQYELMRLISELMDRDKRAASSEIGERGVCHIPTLQDLENM
jgi:DNA-binding NtrC family response regulator